MILQKILYKLSLITGLLLLVVGVLQKALYISASGLVFGKHGTISNGELNANGSLLLSASCLIFSFYCRKAYFQLAKQREEKLKNEKQGFSRSNRKNHGRR